MCKLLGDKCKFIFSEQIVEFMCIYGEFESDIFEECQKLSKVFCNEDFGFYKIIVECLLQFDFQVLFECIVWFEYECVFENLVKSKKKGEVVLWEIEEGQVFQKQVCSVFVMFDLEKVYIGCVDFCKVLCVVVKVVEFKFCVLVEKVIFLVFLECNEEVEVCRDKKGNVEFDIDLCDIENVLFIESIEEYFECEVRLYVLDVWVDEVKMKVGYEILLM